MQRILLFISTIVLSLVSMAQTNGIRQIFLEMPMEVLPTLTSEMKEQLIHNFDQKQKGEVVSEVRNHFYGYSSITKLTEDFVEVKLDTQTTLQMLKLSNGRKKYFVGVIFTSNVTPEQSILVLYDREWRRVKESRYFQHPELADFFVNPSILQLNSTKQVLGAIGALCYRYSWIEEQGALRVEITNFEESTTQSLYPDAAKWLKPGGMLYKWHRGQLRKER